MSYNRGLSPGSRRLANPARVSDSTVDAYSTRFISPRTSGERVIPISTQTFLNPPRDAYSDRARRSSLADRTRRPVLHEIDRSSSPPRTREYYVVPSVPETKSHKKVYSIGEDGAKLVDPHKHRRRESYDKRYPTVRKSIDDDDAFSYTDAAGMFRDTQPSWRERPREASLDRAREAPRSSRREGPPVTSRGFDKINDMGRTRSVREGPVERRASMDPRADSDHDDDYRRSPRRSSLTRRDHSVSRRGFGIRLESPSRSPARKPSPDHGRRDEEARKKERSKPDDRRHDREDYEERRHDRPRDEAKIAVAGLTGAALFAATRDRGNSIDHRPRDRYEDDNYTDDDRRRDDIRRREDRRQRDDRYDDNDRYNDRRHKDDYDDQRHKDDYDDWHQKDAHHDYRAKDEYDDHRHRDDHRQKEDLRAPYPADDRSLGFTFERSEGKKASPPAEAEQAAPLAIMPAPAVDPDEEYRRRIQQAQRDLGYAPAPQDDADRERRRRERESRHLNRHDAVAGAVAVADSPRTSADEGRPELRRRASIIDEPLPAGTQAQVIDNSLSDKRETRVRIVDPPTEEEDKRPKGILKRPTVKFPEEQQTVREGVAPFKDATKKGIPPGARWTKIDRRLVNPEALQDAKERFEERQDCVIVLRVLTKEDIQKLADRTKELREKRFEAQRRAARDRRDRDEYSDDGLEDWERDEKKPTRLLE